MKSAIPPSDFISRFNRPFRELQDECMDPELDTPEAFCNEEFWKAYAQKYGYRKIRGISWEAVL